jgi:hypothetical protein
MPVGRCGRKFRSEFSVRVLCLSSGWDLPARIRIVPLMSLVF